MVKREKRSLQGCPCCTVKTQAPHRATVQATGREGKEMKKYSALVKDGDRVVFIENQDYMEDIRA